MVDVVLDTCTLVHANAIDNDYQEHSEQLIQRILESELFIVVDEGFNLNEALNKSYIGLEYLTHLKPGMLGYTMVSCLAQAGRIKFIEPSLPTAKKQYVIRKVINKKDRHFLYVTMTSTDRSLVSHDFTDYSVDKRIEIKKDLKVNIYVAEEYLELL